MRCVFLSWLLCMVKHQVAWFWIRLFRQKGSGADDIGQFPLTSVFFLYVLKFLLAKILSFLTLCVIPWLDHPPYLKEDLICLGMCSVCCFPVFSLTRESQSSWRDTVRCLTMESYMWAEQQREKESGARCEGVLLSTVEGEFLQNTADTTVSRCPNCLYFFDLSPVTRTWAT